MCELEGQRLNDPAASRKAHTQLSLPCHDWSPCVLNHPHGEGVSRDESAASRRVLLGWVSWVPTPTKTRQHMMRLWPIICIRYALCRCLASVCGVDSVYSSKCAPLCVCCNAAPGVGVVKAVRTASYLMETGASKDESHSYRLNERSR
jgi:hypothetical protein